MEDLGSDRGGDEEIVAVAVDQAELRARLDQQMARQDVLDLAAQARTVSRELRSGVPPTQQQRGGVPPSQQHPAQPASAQQGGSSLPLPPTVSRFGIGNDFLGSYFIPRNDQGNGSGQHRSRQQDPVASQPGGSGQPGRAQPEKAAEPSPQLKRKRKKKGGRAATPPPSIPNSERFPKEDWPRNFTEAQMNSFTPDQIIAMQANQQKKLKLEGKKQAYPGKSFFFTEWVNLKNQLLGVIMGGDENQQPPPTVKLEATEDDCVTKICDARVKLYPIVADLDVFWGQLPVKHEVIQPEFGAKVRGIQNRVPVYTWGAAHDRRRATELKHWSSLNVHTFKQEQVNIEIEK